MVVIWTVVASMLAIGAGLESGDSVVLAAAIALVVVIAALTVYAVPALIGGKM